MKRMLIFIVLLFASYTFSSPGDVIDSFMITGQPSHGIKGLAKDFDDGNIWAVGLETVDQVKFCKFDCNDHSLVQEWMDLQGAKYCLDIAYPYIYGGIPTIVVVDYYEPFLKMFNPGDGGYVGMVDEPFDDGYEVGLAANYYLNDLYCNNGDSDIFRECRRFHGSEWDTFITYDEENNMGVAYGWHHIFIIFSYPEFKIKVFDEQGIFVEEYELNEWGEAYMIGISCGREDVVGENESVFVALYYPSDMIREVEIGNFSKTGVERNSLGAIKAMFH